MFNKLRTALSSGSDLDSSRNSSSGHDSRSTRGYRYGRPQFLNLTEEQVRASANHSMRPIISPNCTLPALCGYAECINGGKSKWNEDQAVIFHGVLNTETHKIPYDYFALFDGHAGVGAALHASRQLHHIVHGKLVDAQDDLVTYYKCMSPSGASYRDLFVKGAIEAAFKDMDDIIKDSQSAYQNMGGCTALVAVFILGHVYVANAGDSRAIICTGDEYRSVSKDFTPETERKRIRRLAQLHPRLLRNEFTYLQFIRQPKLEDLGRTAIYKDAFMEGYSYKTINADDIKSSIITGDGKRSRLMGTIGVTRGFGDHNLLAVYHKVPIKPFLTCHPEIIVYNAENSEEDTVLVMGTDGLWDVVDGNDVCNILQTYRHLFDEKKGCSCAATSIVGAARGTLKDHSWIMKNNNCASVDDISVFVIPITRRKSICLKTKGEKELQKKTNTNIPEQSADKTNNRKNEQVVPKKNEIAENGAGIGNLGQSLQFEAKVLNEPINSTIIRPSLSSNCVLTEAGRKKYLQRKEKIKKLKKIKENNLPSTPCVITPVKKMESSCSQKHRAQKKREKRVKFPKYYMYKTITISDSEYSDNNEDMSNREREKKEDSDNTEDMSNREREKKEHSDNTEDMSNREREKKEHSDNTEDMPNREREKKEHSDNTEDMSNREREKKEDSDNNIVMFDRNQREDSDKNEDMPDKKIDADLDNNDDMSDNPGLNRKKDIKSEKENELCSELYKNKLRSYTPKYCTRKTRNSVQIRYPIYFESSKPITSPTKVSSDVEKNVYKDEEDKKDDAIQKK